ncbi:TonB-dependent receptor domain-containing protein [Taibaiella koreensis]|uniref:TonB-dependent receptor domain-containing protein n=1 Tax=Taibaiella koreensis TaxID=1268548 RepID=UPI000E59FDBC|nr:TonB-dependent receptor [Taibaiella koreensis]
MRRPLTSTHCPFFRSIPFFFICLLWHIIPAGNLKAQTNTLSSVNCSITFSNNSLKEALHQLEGQIPYRFVYTEEDLPGNVKINGTYSRVSLSTVLDALLLRHQLSYSLIKNNIVVSKAAPVKKVKKGILSGSIKDQRTQETIIGAMISVAGQSLQSDADGGFSVELEEGAYSLTISTVGYQNLVRENIQVKAGQDTHLTVDMSQDATALNEVVVTERKIQGTNIALIDQIRSARAIVTGISKEQIGRSQDRDAAEVVRRVPGVSVIQNRFIVIRGIPQRYNSVLLNNVTAPSFEADSRAFSFETIPSGMIDRILIYKTAVPELPGDFSGGVVKIFTTDVPPRNDLNITYQASVRPNTTFRDFYEQKQGKRAWLGFDDGTYRLPKIVSPENPGDMNYSPYLNKNWDAVQKTAGPDHRLGLDFTRNIPLSSRVDLGVVASANYSNVYQSRTVSRNPGQSREELKRFQVGYNLVDNVYEHDVRVNGMANFSLNINKGRHIISFRNLYTHLGTFQYIDRNGEVRSDNDDGLGLTRGMYMKNQVQTNAFKGIYNGQLSGTHRLFANTQVEWLLGYTKSIFNDPDQRTRMQTTPRQGSISDSTGQLIWQEPYNVDGVGNAAQWRRIFLYLPEETKTLAFNITQPLAIGSFKPTLKAGFYFEKKERTFSFDWLNLNVGKGNDTAPTLLYNANPNGYYSASNRVIAGYLAAELPLTARLNLYGGLRVEHYSLNLVGTHWATTGPLAGAVTVDTQIVALLPSVNLSYNLSDKSLVRLAYAKTLNRAEFRELAPFKYFDLNLFQVTYGNPDMRPQVNIQNVDLRFEHYPAVGEMFAAGIFYKHFNHPPELYAQDMGGSGNTYFWGNADKASVYGAEIEMMLGLQRYCKGSSWVAKQLQKISVLANATYSFSKVSMADSFIAFGQVMNFGKSIVQDRPLYGQSPYLVNIGVNFTDRDLGLEANISYNVIGRRILNVGSRNNPNTWEMPRHSLDLTFSQRISRHLELRGGIQNILNSRFRLMQDADYNGTFDKDPDVQADNVERDNRFQSWYDGTCYTLGFRFHLNPTR